MRFFWRKRWIPFRPSSLETLHACTTTAVNSTRRWNNATGRSSAILISAARIGFSVWFRSNWEILTSPLPPSSAAFNSSTTAACLRGALGRVFALAGKSSQAKQVLREILELSTQRYVSPFEPAMIHFALDEADRAFECLVKVQEERCFELISLNADPRFDSLRSDSRLRAIANQMGLM